MLILTFSSGQTKQRNTSLGDFLIKQSKMVPGPGGHLAAARLLRALLLAPNLGHVLEKAICATPLNETVQ
jgi:hypothetical protein